MNLTELLEKTVARLPQTPAFVEEGKVVTYGELAWQVGELAAQI